MRRTACQSNKGKAQVALFGHIHSKYGIHSENKVKFVNAAVTDSPDFLETMNYQIVQNAVQIYL